MGRLQPKLLPNRPDSIDSVPILPRDIASIRYWLFLIGNGYWVFPGKWLDPIILCLLGGEGIGVAPVPTRLLPQGRFGAGIKGDFIVCNFPTFSYFWKSWPGGFQIGFSLSESANSTHLIQIRLELALADLNPNSDSAFLGQIWNCLKW